MSFIYIHLKLTQCEYLLQAQQRLVHVGRRDQNRQFKPIETACEKPRQEIIIHMGEETGSDLGSGSGSRW